MENKTPTIQMLHSVYKEIENTVGAAKTETGGYLFGNRKDFIVTKFVFDDNNRTSCTWTFDPAFINPIITKLWEEQGLELIGFIHSHPTGYIRPSQPDVKVFEKYLKAFKCDRLLVPIVQSSYNDGSFKLYPYIKFQDDEAAYHLVALELLNEALLPKVKEIEEKTETRTAKPQKNTTETQINKNPHVLYDSSRIKEAVDVAKLRNSNILIVGAGGDFALYDMLARTGLGTITAFDFDTVDYSNLTRQGYFIPDVGKYKVLALKQHILAVNPEVNFISLPYDITAYPEDKLEKLVSACDIMLFLTDSFKAQTYGNLLALKYKKPAVWGGFYTKSRCAEIVFYIPGVTPACFRCAVSSRYEAQANKTIKISSNCNTIFHSYFLDAYLGMITMAILHNDTTGYEYSNWFGKHWEHNLIQIKTHPLYQGIFEKKLGDDESFFNFGAVWQKIEREQEPHYKNCPDCIGDVVFHD